MGSRGVLTDAKHVACALFDSERIFRAFATHLQTYGIGKPQLHFDLAGALRRMRDAALLSVGETNERQHDIYGETDGETIWILRGLTFEECVETLLHEAMHDAVFVHRPTRSGPYKGLSCDLEHRVIYGVLDELISGVPTDKRKR